MGLQTALHPMTSRLIYLRVTHLVIVIGVCLTQQVGRFIHGMLGDTRVGVAVGVAVGDARVGVAVGVCSSGCSGE